MSRIEDIADALAVEALDLEDATGDTTVAQQVGDAIGSTSPTMEEAYSTAVRIRRAERRGRGMIDRIRAASVARREPPAS